MQCRNVGCSKVLEEPSNAHLFESVHKHLLFYWLPNASAAKMSPFWYVVVWNDNNCFFSNSPNFNCFFHTWFGKCDISELLVMSHLLSTLWMCLLSFSCFLSLLWAKSYENSHLSHLLSFSWLYALLMSQLQFYAQLTVLFSPLVLTRTVCLFCYISPRKCLKPQTWKSRNAIEYLN